ncbi:olfactory receptor 2K2-like [Pleurodeles waltl]|uniref:olfactory receptor 2K2-like n=1 Tax=Pleurodeles waltl TaxID=8319 RepID=UPI003709AA95
MDLGTLKDDDWSQACTYTREVAIQRKRVVMKTTNQSSIGEFLFVGLSEDPNLQIFLFLLFLVIYIFTVIGNIFMITVCIFEPHFHTPMYFFLSNLSFIDICYSSVIVPNLLNQLIISRRITFSRCAAQMYTYLLMGVTESMLLAVMAYDRYVAISFPLRYTVIISKSVCEIFLGCSWLCGSVFALLTVVFALQLPLCGNNIIDHFFCEATAFVKISCADTSIPQMMFFVIAVFALLTPTLIILISYICIIINIMKISSPEGRYKAFSTCASHLTVVTMVYGSALFLCLKPVSKKADNRDKTASLFYTVIPAMLNPMIYSLRNKDVKLVLKKFVRQNTHH